MMLDLQFFKDSASDSDLFVRDMETLETIASILFIFVV